MALCADPNCGCGIVAGDGVIIGGSGTPGDPWVISMVEPVDIADIQGDIANLQAQMLTLPAAYVNATGDTMTGRLTIDPNPNLHDQITLNKYAATEWAYIRFNAADGTRRGYVGVSPSDEFYVQAEVGNNLILTAVGAYCLMHKTIQSENVVGQEFHPSGAIIGIRGDSSTVFVANKVSTGATASGSLFHEFRLNNTRIGSIARVTTTSAVAYNETSDKDLKENIEPIDDNLALLWLRLVEPVFYNYKDAPEITQVGYIAQDTEEMWPNCVPNGVVSPGHGDVAERTWDDEGHETTPPEVWEPWQVAYGRATPLIHSAVQALDRVVEDRTVVLDDHAARIAELEAIVAAQADRLTALEAAIGGETVDETVDAAVAALRDEMFYTRTMTAGWQYSNTVTAPPGAGQLRTNTALTEMYLHKTDSDGFNRSASLNFIVTRTALDPNCVRFRVRGSSGSVLELRTSAPVIDSGTYLTIPFSILSGTAADKGFRVEVTLLSEIWSEDPPI